MLKRVFCSVDPDYPSPAKLTPVNPSETSHSRSATASSDLTTWASVTREVMGKEWMTTSTAVLSEIPTAIFCSEGAWPSA